MIDNLYLAQLEKFYKAYCRNCIAGQPFAPLVLRGGKNKPPTTAELHQLVHQFQQYEKKDSGNGWKIEWSDWSSKKLGNQKWPSSITVESEEDYIFLLKKENEIRLFKSQLQTLLGWRPVIKDFLISDPFSVLQYKNDWDGICSVIDYIVSNDVRHHYVRSLPVPVHTKFIQDHQAVILSILKILFPDRLLSDSNDIEIALGLQRKSHLFTIRWLDKLLADKYTNRIALLGLGCETLKNVNWLVKEIWLVENETNLYLLPEKKDAMVIFSKGYALNQLYDIPLLHASNLYYWGDLDEDGYIMLNRIRKHYPHIISVCMDEETVKVHSSEIGKQPIKYKARIFDVLTAQENAAFEMLFTLNGRLEQERLNLDYVINKVTRLDS